MNHAHARVHAPLHVARLVIGTLAALALMAAMSAAAAPPPITSDQFAPGWQQHARALFFLGPTMDARDKYRVSSLLPRGEYVLVTRQGDKAVVVAGHRFTVPSGSVDQYLLLPSGLGDVQAIPVSDVPALRHDADSAGLR